jgi:hypothetical protein
VTSASVRTVDKGRTGADASSGAAGAAVTISRYGVAAAGWSSAATAIASRFEHWKNFGKTGGGTEGRDGVTMPL